MTEHLCSKVLVGILEAELLGDRDPVIAHDRCAERLLDQNRLRFRSERYSYRVRQERSAMKNFFSRRATKENLFMRHLSLSPNRFPLFYFGMAAIRFDSSQALAEGNGSVLGNDLDFVNDIVDAQNAPGIPFGCVAFRVCGHRAR